MTAKTRTVSYHWRLRQVMAAHEMYSTTELLPHLEARGVVLSREQVYRLVARVPERLSLTTLAALCDIFEVAPGELIEPVRAAPGKASGQRTDQKAPGGLTPLSKLRPRRAKVATGR
ncbi:MAG: helix-turn-helix domain-containing protein [Solirubrobacteraceae bacterium]